MERQSVRSDGMQRVSACYTGNLVTHVYENRGIMGKAAADIVSGKIKHLLGQQEFVNIIFASAPSQNEFLAALIEKKAIDWKRVNAFQHG